MARSRVRCSFVLLLTLLSLAALAGPSASDAAPTNPLGVTTTGAAGPVLTGVACTVGTPGILLVTGAEFSPGGEVEVLLFRPGSATPAVSRSLRASLHLRPERQHRSCPRVRARRICRYRGWTKVQRDCDGSGVRPADGYLEQPA